METAEFKRRGRLVHNQCLDGLNTVCARPALADQPLAVGIGSQHIHDVTRADMRTLAWLVPLTVVLVLGWLFLSDRCLDDEISSHLRTMNPPALPGIVEAPLAPDAVVIDNPYGIQTGRCHHWPDAMDHAISIGTLVAIALFVGFLSARNFQQRARIRAAVIMFVAMFLAGSLNQWVYLPYNMDYIEWAGFGAMWLPLTLMLAVLLGPATIAWFAALFTQRLRARVY
jgi:hypothetical protein